MTVDMVIGTDEADFLAKIEALMLTNTIANVFMTEFDSKLVALVFLTDKK